jgi:TatD DNase family protein
MIQSDNGKKIITEIPKNLILTETDFPFIENSSINDVYQHLAQLWGESVSEIEHIIDSNFKRILQNIK